jgi:hypothetical protein
VHRRHLQTWKQLKLAGSSLQGAKGVEHARYTPNVRDVLCVCAGAAALPGPQCPRSQLHMEGAWQNSRWVTTSCSSKFHGTQPSGAVHALPALLNLLRILSMVQVAVEANLSSETWT